MARRLLLNRGPRDIGERLLTAKLQMLNGTANRRPSLALSILTGRVAEQLSILESFYAEDPVVADTPSMHPLVRMVRATRPHFQARTVYLSESHVRDVDAIIDAWQSTTPRRLTRSAVLRRAIEHLRDTIDTDPANSLLESQSSCQRS
jgi:hypothetical protein